MSSTVDDHANQDDLKILEDASYAIGSAVIVINFVEQGLDMALTHYFQLESATFSLLPMLDFRSKMLVIQRDSVLNQIFDSSLRKRLHKLYDKRNVLAHGYVKFAKDGVVLKRGEPFEVRHPRHEDGLCSSDVKALHIEASLLVGLVVEAIEEITDFLNPLVALRQNDPDGTPAEFVARLRRQIDELAEGSE